MTQLDSHEWNRDDRVLLWTMRIVGCSLAMLSLIFLTHDIVQGSTATYFFSISAGLGIVTLITSWLPGAEAARLTQQRAMRYARSVAH